MKLYLKLMILLLTFLNINNAFADDVPGVYCLDTNTGQWLRFGGNVAMNRQMNIGGRQYPTIGMQANTQRVFSMNSIYLQCRNSFIDTATYTMRIQEIYRPNSSYTPGLINGSYISYAYSGRTSFRPTNYQIITLPSRNTLRTLQIDPSLVIYSTGTAIPSSGSLGKFEYVLLRNGSPTGLTLDINLTASSTIVFQPETCDVNGGLPINIDLGVMSPSDIPTASGSLQNGNNSRQINLNFKCSGSVTSKVGVQLVGQQSSFSQTVIEARTGQTANTGTVIPHLGVEFYHNGTPLQPNIKDGGFTAQITNGSGNATLVVSPIKSPEVYDIDLPAGYFNATATLVLVQP